MSDSLHGLHHTWLPCPSLFPGVCSNSCPLSQWCHPTISLCPSFSTCPQSFPASGNESNELALCTRWPKSWSFSISPSNEYPGLLYFRIDWFENDLLLWSVTLYARLGTAAKITNTLKIRKSQESHCPNAHGGSTCCAAENTESCLEKALYTENFNGMFHQETWVTFTPGLGGATQSPLGLVCCKSDLLEKNTHHWKEEEVEILLWHILPASPSPPGWQCCLPWTICVRVCIRPGQVPKAAHLKARWACSVFHWYNHLAAFFPPLAWRTL